MAAVTGGIIILWLCWAVPAVFLAWLFAGCDLKGWRELTFAAFCILLWPIAFLWGCFDVACDGWGAAR
ncbi:hypothetical protein D1610_11660 [Sphingomonas gilva]|uniref:Uncharacterized protein n=1 Tax=Sphingomonas gilva TaxID=2305907 RepID=A0A396RLU5_9SPHN|nr:hypothetical protein D1610_11660 [Sphingomonas gilva]